jgi:hypothetical protein
MWIVTTQPGASRRTFLTNSLVVATGVSGLAAGAAVPASAQAGDVGIQETQTNWRFCDKCYVLFYAGYPTAGRCAAGGAHNAQGWNFTMYHKLREDATWQTDWRFCMLCYSLVWPWHEPIRPTCPAAPAGQRWHHSIEGYIFQCAHDLPETSWRQANWRFCWNCYSMFYWGFASNGVCKAGGGHLAQGWNFVMFHY